MDENIPSSHLFFFSPKWNASLDRFAFPPWPSFPFFGPAPSWDAEVMLVAWRHGRKWRDELKKMPLTNRSWGDFEPKDATVFFFCVVCCSSGVFFFSEQVLKYGQGNSCGALNLTSYLCKTSGARSVFRAAVCIFFVLYVPAYFLLFPQTSQRICRSEGGNLSGKEWTDMIWIILEQMEGLLLWSWPTGGKLWFSTPIRTSRILDTTLKLLPRSILMPCSEVGFLWLIPRFVYAHRIVVV